MGGKEPVKHDAKKADKKSPEVVEVEDGEYEYYSSSSEDEPPPKKAKKDSGKATSSKGVMDLEGWKRRALELEKIANKLTKENKILRKRVLSLKENWRQEATLLPRRSMSDSQKVAPEKLTQSAFVQINSRK